MLRFTWWMCAALAASGCSLGLDWSPEGVPCDATHGCAAGLTCSSLSHRCVRTGPQATPPERVPTTNDPEPVQPVPQPPPDDSQPSAGVNGFAPAAPLTAARSGHAAVVLPSGKVLVVGGFGGTDGQSALAAAELYDPATQSWTAAGTLAHPRGMAAAELLSDGSVLVAGGASRSSSADDLPLPAERFKPGTGWSVTGALAAGRFGATATRLGNGEVLIAGGYPNTAFPGPQPTEVYSPTTGTFRPGPAVPWRYQHRAALLPSGAVFLVGGAGQGYLHGSVRVDVAGNRVAPGPSMRDGRAAHTLSRLTDGRLLVAGGQDSDLGVVYASAELYEPARDDWESMPDMAEARSQHAAVVLRDGQVLVVGGKADGKALHSAERFDPMTERWSPAGALSTARWGHTATLLLDGSVLVVGGSTADGATASCERFIPGD